MTEESSADRYQVRGRVTEVDAQKPSVTLDHEEIEGLMPAMQMEFPVENSDVLSGIEAGDQVQGTLVKRDGQNVLVELQQATK